jgi:hypothetical protein
MENKRPTELLKERISQLELQQTEEGLLLKEQFNTTYESLKPLNLIKNAFKDFTSSPETKSDLVNAVVGIATGFLTNRLLIGSSTGIIKKVGALVLELGLVKVLAQNSDKIGAKASEWIKTLVSKRKKIKKNKTREFPAED